LDIDGVLVTSAQFYTKKLHPKYQTHPFDKKCVQTLNKIIEEINPIIILSSDWKFHFELHELNEIFCDNGVIEKITDITPNLWGGRFTRLSQLEECRAFEILEFIDEKKIANFVAVDDLNLKHWLKHNFVHCPHANEGIKQTNIKEKIIENINTLNLN
jgi:hypothetical protein